MCERGSVDGLGVALVVQTPAGLSRERLVGLVQALLDRHAMLRARLERSDGDGGESTLRVGLVGSVTASACIRRVDAIGLDREGLRQVIEVEAAVARARLAPRAGVMVQVVWLDCGPARPGRLLVCAHRLVVDGVSLRILLEDLATGGAQAAAGRPVVLPPCGTSFRRWAQLLTERAQDPAQIAELAVWTAVLDGRDPPLGDRPFDPACDTVGTCREMRLTLPAARAEPLLTRVPAAFHAGVDDVLLCGLALVVAQWRRRRGEDDQRGVLIDLGGHGREQVAPGVDLSRTVGWSTGVFPVRLDVGGADLDEALAGGPAAGKALKGVKEQLRAVPDHGLGFGLLRYLNPETGAVLAGLPAPQIMFNYLGRFNVPNADDWALVPDSGRIGTDLGLPVSHSLDITAWTEDLPDGSQLHVKWVWPGGLLTEEAVRELAQCWFQALDALAVQAAQPGAGGHTPSDFPLARLS
ncbi:MAG: condensation domain-containing protein, partial [Pseudonocardiaceae bacterium]